MKIFSKQELIESIKEISLNGWHKMKKLLLFIMFLLFFVSCYKPILYPETGDIYGQLVIKNYGTDYGITEEETIENVTIRIEGFNKYSKIDSKKTFYIPNIPPGEYIIIAEAPDFTSTIKEKVKIAADSISLVYEIGVEFPKRSTPFKSIWKGKKIKRINVTKRGAIYGNFYLSGSTKIVPAIIVIEGMCLATTTDNKGNFYFDALLPGSYNISGSSPGYIDVNVKNIVVVPDSISIVPLSSSFVGISRTYNWKKKYKSIR